ncbi:group-specific protein [Heyndrickxia acidicola]|uniref:Group-specific protein n=1 Tax=Heyndrickxia acidicola TaxID=209389 RepID=A0ABU6MMF7_9BACI|nr:group-specific protein [Heyndrickxia acidicola]MED1205868.1 group-specific protein [Heyndrickxia acidicola]
MLDIELKVDEKEIRRLYLEKLDEHIEKIDKERTFWDTKELQRQTMLSWSTIQNEFFYDERFPKYKLGRKWMFPAKKTREFLLMWIEEQKRR